MTHLVRKLDTFGLAMIAIGSCIGSGVFVTPAESIEHLPNYYMALLPWVLGGLATYMGAMTFSELSTRYPKSGGVYVYITEAYGPLAGFLYGWSILLIVNTGALAALAFAFADFLNFFLPIEGTLKPIIASATILILSIINTRGVGVSQVLAKLFTSLKLLALLSIVMLAIWYVAGGNGHWSTGASQPIPDNWWNGILIAFVGVFWSFGGWHHATYVSGEAIEPQRTVPKAMLYGTLTVTAVYLTVIWSYMSLAPLHIIQFSERIAGDAVANAISGGGKLVSIMITISIFGTIAIYTMSAPRIYHAMATDKIFFKKLSEIHPKYKTPALAIMVQAIWAIILIWIWGSFSKLITFVTFMDILFMSLATASIFVFRMRSKEKPTYQVRPYPLVPLIYLAISMSFVLYVAFSLRAEAVVGMLILAIGVPLFYYFRKSNLIE